jgi:hypothetical protein
MVKIHDRQSADQLIREAARWNLGPAVLATVIVLSRLDPDTASSTAFTGVSELLPAIDRRRADGLTELFFHQLDKGPINRDLLLVVRPSNLVRVVRGLVGGRRRYREQMRSFEIREHGEAVPLGTRLQSLVEALRRMPGNGWRMVRSLAVVKAALTRRTEP